MKKFIFLILGIAVMISCDSNNNEISAESEMTLTEDAVNAHIENSETDAFKDELTDIDDFGEDKTGYFNDGNTVVYKGIASSSFCGSTEDSNPETSVNYLKPKPSIFRKVIWTAYLKIEVDCVATSTKALQNIIGKYDGHIASMDMSSSDVEIRNKIEIRISNEKFNKLIDELKGQAIKVDELKINSNDVTEEFIDINSRLKTKKEVRDRYIAVLRTKAGTVKDIIAAEEAIRNITEEIEAKEGRLRYLNDRVNLSTITLTLYQNIEKAPEPEIMKKPYVKKVVEGLGNGWAFIKGFVLVLVNIWPLILIVIIFLWKRKWIMKKLKKD